MWIFLHSSILKSQQILFASITNFVFAFVHLLISHIAVITLDCQIRPKHTFLIYLIAIINTSNLIVFLLAFYSLPFVYYNNTTFIFLSLLVIFKWDNLLPFIIINPPLVIILPLFLIFIENVDIFFSECQNGRIIHTHHTIIIILVYRLFRFLVAET